jgi:hypothetical protein
MNHCATSAYACATESEQSSPASHTFQRTRWWASKGCANRRAGGVNGDVRCDFRPRYANTDCCSLCQLSVRTAFERLIQFSAQFYRLGGLKPATAKSRWLCSHQRWQSHRDPEACVGNLGLLFARTITKIARIDKTRGQSSATADSFSTSILRKGRLSSRNAELGGHRGGGSGNLTGSGGLLSSDGTGVRQRRHRNWRDLRQAAWVFGTLRAFQATVPRQ